MTNDTGASHDFRFQVDLGGIIDLLSHHLYSGPQVYIRELLQNAVDAIRARRHLEPEHRGEIRLELVEGAQPTLVLRDDGVGLTEQEVHRFLATIGQSSKRGTVSDRPDDFLGQFGIGLLSCFVVCEEIVVITRSAREPRALAVEWRGRADGTYTLRTLPRDMLPGTEVYLRAKPTMTDYFAPAKVRELAEYFGGFLPYSMQLTAGGETRAIEAFCPWRDYDPEDPEHRRLLMEYAEEAFGVKFMEAIPLESQTGGVQGIAFVLPFASSLAAKRGHRVYLKNMLLSEKVDNILPEWAFFVQCVVNADGLRPTASRESFYEDETLEAARAALGDCLRRYLVNLARRDPQRLERLVHMHHLSIKALALVDDECFHLFAGWLPFETSLGEMNLSYIRQEFPHVRYCPTRDKFRQVAQVAAAQSMCVINAGYTYDEQVLLRLPEVYPDVTVEQLDVDDLSEGFEDVTSAEREQLARFLEVAAAAIEPYGCVVELRRFKPVELPALYATNDAADFLRSVEQSKEVANDLWANVLDRVAADASLSARARLYFNFENRLVQRIAALAEPEAQARAAEMLYVQALLLGHVPLRGREMQLLNEGLLGLIDWAVR